MDKNCVVTLAEADVFSGSGDSDTGTGSSLASPACFDVLVDSGNFNLSKKSILEKSERDFYFQYQV